MAKLGWYNLKVPAPKVSAYKNLFRSKGAGNKIKVKK